MKFNLAPANDAENGVSKQERVGGLIENLPFNQLPDNMRFSSMGGVPPILRAGIIRVALAKLAMTGVLAALVAMHTSLSNTRAAFSCALAAAVNFVACFHYWHIMKIRAQELPTGFLSFASGRGSSGEWVGRASNNSNDQEKMFLQEFLVDGLRYTDWTCTLVFMSLDLHDLVNQATLGVEANIDKYVASALMPLMVFFGGVYRFYANEIRGKKLESTGETQRNVDMLQVLVGVVSFVLSCVLFVIVVVNIIEPFVSGRCSPNGIQNDDGLCTIANFASAQKNDAYAVLILTLVWVGYPIVAIASRSFLPMYGFPKTAYVSVFKDIAYAVLDVVSKGGLALYVSYRTQSTV